MPIHEYGCPECGRREDAFVHAKDDHGCDTKVCPCGSSMAPLLSVGAGLTFFEEGRARTIMNLGPQPVTVRSHAEHQRLMKQYGVEWATPGTGRKGSWQ